MAFTLLNEAPIEGPDIDPAMGYVPDAAEAARARRASEMVSLALRALGQRALVAVAAIFSLVLAGSVFWLAMTVAGNPSVKQLVLLGLYSVFVVVLHVVRRTK